MVLHLYGLEGLESRVGTDLGDSRWVCVDQSAITAFATATLDRNPLHLDSRVARAAGFDGTIAHGFLSLSLIAGLLADVFVVDGVSNVLNYGLNRVRLPEPVPVGSRLRLSVTLRDVVRAEAHADAVLACTMAAEGIARPVCVADLILRYRV